MRAGRHSRFTVFDVMEAKGLFDTNKANISSPQYSGPLEYPKMFYHPTGKKRIVQKAELLNTPFGPQRVGEQFELISRVAKDEAEAEKLEAAGWHDHPSKAIAASGEKAPPMTAHGRIADLERQVLVLQNQIKAAQAGPMPEADEEDEDLKPLPTRPVPAPSGKAA